MNSIQQQTMELGAETQAPAQALVQAKPNQDVATTKQSTEQMMIEQIAKMAADPNVDPDKIEKLLNIQITMMDRQAKMYFDQALSRIQEKMPRITPKGEIKNNAGTVVARYMKYENIDEVLRPMLQEEGFSLLHSREDISGGKMLVTTTLKHREGHEESVSIPLPYGKPNQLKSEVQAAVETASYGKRHNVCALFNIVAEGEDDAASQARITIDDAQAAKIKETLRLTNADVKKFLAYMKVDCVEDIPMKDYQKALMALGTQAIGVLKKSKAEE